MIFNQHNLLLVFEFEHNLAIDSIPYNLNGFKLLQIIEGVLIINNYHMVVCQYQIFLMLIQESNEILFKTNLL